MARLVLTISAIFLSLAAPANAQKNKGIQPISNVTYADIADLADGAAIVAEVKVRRAQKIKQKGAPAGTPARFLVDADVLALIRGSAEGLPPRIRYMAQAVPDARGKLPKFDRAVMIVFAQPVENRPAEVQLVAPDAQIWWSEQLGMDTRTVLRAMVSPHAPSKVIGITNAYHSPGALAGEGDTQIFLSTADESAVSLMITRRAGQPPHWTAAYGDVVDPDAPPPAQNTLGWYRLACFLPNALPQSVLDESEVDQREAIVRDYTLARQALGVCKRMRVKA